MTTYQDIVAANGAIGAWALVEASGTDFAPYVGGTHLVGSGSLSYLQAGPFATSEALGLAVGESLHLPFGKQLQPPFTTEAWLKLSSLAPPSYQLLLRNGVTGSTGSGFYMQGSDHHVHWTGSSDVDTGYVWPNTGWHLVDWTTSLGATVTRLYVDGVLVWSQSVSSLGGTATTTGYLSDGSADNSHVAGLVAFPAVYATELSPGEVWASFLASTDPAAALPFTAAGPGQISTANALLLSQILAAVRKTY